MRAAAAALAASVVAGVSAHFQLQYPAPRGVFVEKQEPNFCDGYTNAVENRTVFPLKGGMINLNSEHDSWDVGVLLSTKQNPSQPSDFNTTASGGIQQTVVPFTKQNGQGLWCIPIEITSLGIAGVTDGANVTIEIAFSGPDGTLFQCADLTLSSNAPAPSPALQCAHQAVGVTAASPIPSAAPATAAPATASGSMTMPMNGSMTMPMTSGTAPASSPSASHTSGATKLAVSGVAGLLGAAAVAIAAL